MSWHRTLTAYAVMASLLMSGCSSNISVREDEPLNNDRIFNFDQVNDRLKDTPVTIVTRFGSEVNAEQVHVSKDSTLFMDVKLGRAGGMATSDVLSIRYRDHGTGAVSGFLTGLLGGVVVGWIIILVNNDHSSHHGLANLGILFLSVPGTGLVGLMAGAAFGSSIEYKFQEAHAVKESLPDSTKLGAP
jgi:hypothetical protein